jgi:DNA-binding NtrC family response regulator
MAAHLVIFDPELSRGGCGSCSQIGVLARQAFGGEPLRVTTVQALGQEFRDPEPDMVVLRAPAGTRLAELLRPLREMWRATPVVAAVCKIPHDAAELLESFHAGLDDFFCCPFAAIELVARLRRWLPDRNASRKRPQALRDLKLDTLVGESASFLEAIGWIPRVASSMATVLIGGETGVGKELFARAIHYNGERRSRPFIPINCSALPDHLFENEVFGHVRGAYTDARSAEKGLLGEAEGGTVFFDEIDTLTPSSQAKLLRLLQDREYRPLGSSKTLVADTRVIAATNTDLRELVAEHRFREDLFHRLNVLSLRVPALRDRLADIPLLAAHFLERYAAQYNRGNLRFSPGAQRKMLSYSWPGNVREMEGLLHRAVVFGAGATVEASDIELPMAACAARAPVASAKDDAMGEFERGYLVNLLAEHRGNVSHSARAAGKDRRTFQRLLRKHGIERLAFGQAS